MIEMIIPRAGLNLLGESVALPHMKLAFSTLVCPDWTLEQIASFAAEQGIGGVDFRGLQEEIDVTRLAAFNDDLPQTLSLFQRHGLQIPCFQTSVTLMTPAADRWQMMLEEAQRHARLAERTHTRYLRVFGGSPPRDMNRDESFQLALRHLRQVSKICAGFGCVPLLETHDAWSSSQTVLELIHEFDPDEVGALWDIEHPFRAGESPAATCQALRRYIRHIHFKDSAVRAGKSIPTLLGQGDLPLVDSIQALKSIEYDGWICLETEKRWHRDESPEPEQNIHHFARFMASMEERG
jgi:fatty-acyl-CoA synthase